MFHKPFRIKSNVVCKPSQKRQVKKKLCGLYPHLAPGILDNLIPLRVPLFMIKLTAYGGVVITVYHSNGEPVFFEHAVVSLPPTVYAVWRYPDILHTVVIMNQTFSKLQCGADLVLPWVVTEDRGGTSLIGIKKGQYCSLRVRSQSYLCGIAVALLHWEDMLKNELKGKGFRVIHLQGDLLWEMGPMTTPIDTRLKTVFKEAYMNPVHGSKVIPVENRPEDELSEEEDEVVFPPSQLPEDRQKYEDYKAAVVTAICAREGPLDEQRLKLAQAVEKRVKYLATVPNPKISSVNNNKRRHCHGVFTGLSPNPEEYLYKTADYMLDEQSDETDEVGVSLPEKYAQDPTISTSYHHASHYYKRLGCVMLNEETLKRLAISRSPELSDGEEHEGSGDFRSWLGIEDPDKDRETSPPWGTDASPSPVKRPPASGGGPLRGTKDWIPPWRSRSKASFGSPDPSKKDSDPPMGPPGPPKKDFSPLKVPHGLPSPPNPPLGYSGAPKKDADPPKRNSSPSKPSSRFSGPSKKDSYPPKMPPGFPVPPKKDSSPPRKSREDRSPESAHRPKIDSALPKKPSAKASLPDRSSQKDGKPSSAPHKDKSLFEDSHSGSAQNGSLDASAPKRPRMSLDSDEASMPKSSSGKTTHGRNVNPDSSSAKKPQSSNPMDACSLKHLHIQGQYGFAFFEPPPGFDPDSVQTLPPAVLDNLPDQIVDSLKQKLGLDDLPGESQQHGEDPGQAVPSGSSSEKLKSHSSKSAELEKSEKLKTHLSQSAELEKSEKLKTHSSQSTELEKSGSGALMKSTRAEESSDSSRIASRGSSEKLKSHSSKSTELEKSGSGAPMKSPRAEDSSRGSSEKPKSDSGKSSEPKKPATDDESVKSKTSSSSSQESRSSTARKEVESARKLPSSSSECSPSPASAGASLGASSESGRRANDVPRMRAKSASERWEEERQTVLKAVLEHMDELAHEGYEQLLADLTNLPESERGGLDPGVSPLSRIGLGPAAAEKLRNFVMNFFKPQKKHERNPKTEALDRLVVKYNLQEDIMNAQGPDRWGEMSTFFSEHFARQEKEKARSKAESASPEKAESGKVGEDEGVSRMVEPGSKKATPMGPGPVFKKATPTWGSEKAKPTGAWPGPEKATPLVVEPASKKATPTEAGPASKKATPIEAGPASKKATPIEAGPASKKATPTEVEPLKATKPRGPGTKWSPGASEDDIGITLPDEYRSRELSPDLPPGGSESDGSERERDGEGATASCSVGMGMDQEEEEEEEEGVDMDELVKECFLAALKTLAGRKSEAGLFPLLTSTFYRSFMLESCPSDLKLDIKKSSYRKLSKFLLTMQSQGVVKLGENDKGVEVIVTVDFRHPLVKSFTPSLLPEATSSGEAPSTSLSGVRPPIKTNTLYIPSHRLAAFFKPFGFSKASFLDYQQVRDCVMKYIADNQLVNLDNPRQVVPDLLLGDALQHKGVEAGQGVPRQDLLKMIVDEMRPAYSITTGASRPVLKKGTLDPVRLSVVQKMGNKKVTLVDNLHLYGIPPADVAQSLQKVAAASTTINDMPGKSSVKQVQVQGNAVKVIAKLLQVCMLVGRVQAAKSNERYLLLLWKSCDMLTQHNQENVLIIHQTHLQKEVWSGHETNSYGVPLKHIEAIDKIKPPKVTQKKKKRK